MKGTDRVRMGMKLLMLANLVVLLVAAGAAQGQDKYQLKDGAKGKLCLQCHGAFQEKLKEASVHTPLKRGECTGCHNPHTSSRAKLLAENTDSVCFRCHASLIPEKAASVHAVVAEGKCVRCHDPHAAPNKNNLLAAGNALCFGCHTELKESIAKAKHQHQPVEKDCLACHTPHASADSPKLLNDRVPLLCTKCHKTDRPVFNKQHMNYPVGKSACTSCHNPHGSDQRGILYDTVHKPVASRMCNQCHEEPGSPRPLATKQSGYDLCRGCHSPMIRLVLEKKRLHWPVLAKNGCQGCHSPHASKYKGLLRQSQSGLCGSCHADTMEYTVRAKVQHQPVKEGLCTSCHSPHSADNPQLLAQAELQDLCGMCHDWRKHSNHPVGSKYRDLRNKNLPVDCSSCHRTHGTDYKRMLLQPTVTEVCVQCHEKFRR